jgi:hypothetical protein
MALEAPPAAAVLMAVAVQAVVVAAGVVSGVEVVLVVGEAAAATLVVAEEGFGATAVGAGGGPLCLRLHVSLSYWLVVTALSSTAAVQMQL